MIDGANIRAHPQAAGAKKGAPTHTSAGVKGGWGSTLHLVTERSGKPVVCVLTPGQRQKSPEAIPLLEQATERMWPEALAGDNDYTSTIVRNWLRHREIEAVIPRRKDAIDIDTDDRALYRERAIIEQTINWLRRWRRIATRFEKRAASYLDHGDHRHDPRMALRALQTGPRIILEATKATAAEEFAKVAITLRVVYCLWAGWQPHSRAGICEPSCMSSRPDRRPR